MPTVLFVQQADGGETIGSTVRLVLLLEGDEFQALLPMTSRRLET